MFGRPFCSETFKKKIRFKPFIGGMDADRDKGLQWITGADMTFTDFRENEPSGNPYLHMHWLADDGFVWDTKDDADDKDNGFICKKPVA